MLTNEREKRIHEKYSAKGADGLVSCDVCPLLKGNWKHFDFRCKANSHYNRRTREWEYDTDYGDVQ